MPTASPDADPHIVRAADVPLEPWRNGGGHTRQLLALPTREVPAGWWLRVSLAEIEADGPFSAYADVERWFAVVRGAGVRLAWPDRAVDMRAGDAPLRFDGADAPEARLLDGPTQDLNLMLCGGRGVLRAAVPGAAWDEAHALRGCFSAVACRVRDAQGREHALPALSLLWALPPGPCRVESDAPGSAWWIGATTAPAA